MAFVLALCGCSAASAASVLYDIRDYGAKPDGQTLCTQAIQEAVDHCAGSGGGVVYLPPGKFLSGTIVMKSGVTLQLDNGCTLLGSPDLAQYPAMVPAYRSYTDTYTDKSLLYGEKLERVAITGRGVIDGQGAAFHGPYKVRPYMIRLIGCRDVVVEGVTLRNSPMWVQHYLACDDVRLDGITVQSHVNLNNDGIDIDSCRRVLVTGCNIDSGDDAIVLKSTSDRLCEDVVVTGCVLRSACNALKLGTESNGGFQNIVMTACTIYDTRLAGVALEVVDGGMMDRVVVTSITMSGVALRSSSVWAIARGPSGRTWTSPASASFETSRSATLRPPEPTTPDAPSQACPMRTSRTFRSATFACRSRAAERLQDAAESVPENPDKYPEYAMFGKLPAYGFYCRHVRGLTMRNVQLQLVGEDKRHAVVFEDVHRATVDGLDVPHSNGAAPLLRFTDVQSAIVRGCTPPEGTGVFLKVQGEASRSITLTSNDFSGVKAVVQVGADVPRGAVTKWSNRTN